MVIKIFRCRFFKKAELILFFLLFCNFFYGQVVQEKISNNDDWYFIQQDDSIFSTQVYDHSGWRKLCLPHDWSIEGAYDESNPMGGTGGYLPAGIGFYRKTIDVPSAWKGNVVNVLFDGVFMNSTVWANGKKLGVRPYGWSSFVYDISDIVNSSEQITIAVRVDNELQPAARWYTGSGIYSNTWIEVMNPVHIQRQGGLFIRTDSNQVIIDTELFNGSGTKVSLKLKTRILDSENREVAGLSNKLAVSGSQQVAQTQKLVVENPVFWSVETPYLYTAVSEVWNGNVLLDRVTTRFGIRDLEWIPQSGLWLNGKNVKLHGVCNHQDAGALGVAVPEKILRYRIQQLKNMGCNAIRTTHNPQTPEFYNICDEMGMLVMDEVFDGWKQKAKNDYGGRFFKDWWQTDLTDWIKRDRNHPSVIIYSVGNETGGAVGEEIVALCHAIDSTRLVTSGHSGTALMDVVGVNGASEKNNYLQALDKDRVVIGTENTHTWQVRGYYRTQTWYRDGESVNGLNRCDDLTQHEIFFNDWILNEDRSNAKQVFNSSYDNAYVRLNSRGSIEQIRDNAFFAGSFRWTGYDYIGEAGYVHGGWPFRAFMGGAIDLANFEKDLYYLYQSQWTGKPMVHILPHWTHPFMESGTEIPVWVYSNCDEVELFLNGQSLGRQTPGKTRYDMQCQWLVPWQPGKIKAIGYCADGDVIEESIVSACRPAQNHLSIDGDSLCDEGKDIVQVRVSAQDSLGNFYPYGENRTFFKVLGPAQIRALDNGSPIDVEPHFGVDNRNAFYGLTRAYIESTGKPGDIHLLASAIMGEKKQITSNRISIDTQILTLRGNDISPDIKIYYTTDGSVPSRKSELYRESFSVPLGTTVKAIVIVDGETLQLLSERFAEDEGFVWNDPHLESVGTETGSNQAEDAAFEGAVVSTVGQDFKGTGFLDFGQNANGYVEWYRENDGDAYEEILNIRYSCQIEGQEGRFINIIVNGVQIATELLPNTGSWGNDWNTVSVKINLQRGANTIRLQNSANGGPYLDQISFGDMTNIR
jgi:beta-galactosidase